MRAFVEALRKAQPGRRVAFRVLTGSPESGRTLFEGLADTSVARVPPQEVPSELQLSDLGLAFREPSFSQAGVCPIKVGEYLLCGVPVVANGGIGDLDAVLRPAFASVVATLDEGTVRRAGANLDITSLDGSAARAAGEDSFSLTRAVQGYRAALRPQRGGL